MKEQIVEQVLAQILVAVVDPKLRDIETRGDVIRETVGDLENWADGVGDLVSVIWDAIKPQLKRVRREMAACLKEELDSLVAVGFTREEAVQIVVAMAGKSFSSGSSSK